LTFKRIFSPFVCKIDFSECNDGKNDQVIPDFMVHLLMPRKDLRAVDPIQSFLAMVFTTGMSSRLLTGSDRL